MIRCRSRRRKVGRSKESRGNGYWGKIRRPVGRFEAEIERRLLVEMVGAWGVKIEGSKQLFDVLRNG